MTYSIIVPAYNVEKFLGRCLDSLVNQTYNNLEIIIVDDGSTDNTLKIARKYAKKYHNIIVCHQKNSGIAMARYYGMKKASGDYCLTVDADDWLDGDALEKVDNALKGVDGVDVLKFRYVKEPSEQKSKEYEITNRILNDYELKKIRTELLLSNRYNNLCNQVFKRELYNNVDITQIGRINYSEDLMVNLDILGRATRVLFINDAIYHYYENPDSTTRRIIVENITKNIADDIIVNKKRVKYKKIFDLNDVSVDEIKSMVVYFVCMQIRNYVLTCDRLDIKKMRDSITSSGIYEYLDGSKVDVSGAVNSIIAKCIMKRRYRILFLMKPLAEVRFHIKQKTKIIMRTKINLIK